MTAATEDRQTIGESVNFNHDPLFDEKAAAAYLGLAARTMQALRYRGGGPIFHRLGTKRVMYRQSDLEAWITAGRRSSTSDAGPSHAYEN